MCEGCQCVWLVSQFKLDKWIILCTMISKLDTILPFDTLAEFEAMTRNLHEDKVIEYTRLGAASFARVSAIDLCDSLYQSLVRAPMTFRFAASCAHFQPTRVLSVSIEIVDMRLAKGCRGAFCAEAAWFVCIDRIFKPHDFGHPDRTCISYEWRGRGKAIRCIYAATQSQMHVCLR